MIVLLSAAAAGLWMNSRQKARQAAFEQMSRVETVQVTKQNLIDSISVTGTIQSADAWDVSASAKNVELPMLYAGVHRKKRTERARELLDMVGMDDRMAHNPDELSGGQKQRVAIARAMANDPSIILADEPTGALDSKTGHMIMDIFHKLNKEQGKTIVLITHPPELAEETLSDLEERYADSISGFSLTENIGSGTAQDGDLYAYVSASGVNEANLENEDLTLLAGRSLTARDQEEARKVALVSDLFVENMFGGDQYDGIHGQPFREGDRAFSQFLRVHRGLLRILPGEPGGKAGPRSRRRATNKRLKTGALCAMLVLEVFADEVEKDFVYSACRGSVDGRR